MTDSPISILADRREQGAAVIQNLLDLPGVQVKIETLPLGDYEINRTILFERKTMPDLVSSIIDGRLFRQACRLAASPRRCAIILEGTSSHLADSGMRREAI